MINDDTLLLYLYQDGLSDAERKRVGDALDDDESLRRRYQQLSEDLQPFRELPNVVPEPGVVASWRNAFEREVGIDPVVPETQARWLRYFEGFPAVLATVIPVVFLAGWWLGTYRSDLSPVQRTSVATAHVEQAPVATAVPAAFVRGVSRHFEHTQIQLASLESVSAHDDRSALVSQMIAQNRFYLREAKQKGAHDIARLLRAFEPLLLDLAEQASSENKTMRSREQLEFELGVTLTKLEQRASNNMSEF